MGKPAARVTDMHSCPLQNPGPVPHVGGPITGPGAPTVLIGGVPAAVVGDMATCAGPIDTIASGSTGVFFMGKPAARMGDMTSHGGTIAQGFPTVLIGETAGGVSAGAGVRIGTDAPPDGADPISAPAGAVGALTPAASSISAQGGARMGLDGSDSPNAPTWIGFQLLTTDGHPVPNEPFSATLDNGQTLNGMTDASGYAEFSGIAKHSSGDVEFSEIPFDKAEVEAPTTQAGIGSRPAPRPLAPPAAQDSGQGRRTSNAGG